MKKIYLFRWLIPILPIFILIGIQCSRNKNWNESKLKVAASIVPVADFVRQVGGEHVSVLTVVPPNTDPHTFELTPDLLVQIFQSRLLIINGVGLEFWVSRVQSNINSGKLQVIDTSSGVMIVDSMHSEHSDAEHHHPSGNPHIWLNPQNAVIQVQNIKNALIEADSLHAADYEKNAEKFIQLLLELDNEIASEIKTWKMHKFVCYHPAWEYFANRYGLEQAAVIQKSPGSEPGPKEIAGIIDTIKQLNVRAIFAEAQFPDALTKAVADESGIFIINLDPIGSTTDITDYLDMMRYNVRQMASALKE